MTSIHLTTTTNNTLTLQDFCDLTRKACQLKHFPSNEIVNHPHGWTKLAEAWEALIDEADVDIFCDATYFVKWGIQTEYPTPEYQALIAAVSNALTQDGPANDAWINHSHCLCTIYDTAREPSPWGAGATTFSFSDWHHRYTAFKMLLRIFRYRKGYITDCKRYEKHIRYYENCIVKLLPNATAWSAEYWFNENNIFAELQKACHFDYRNDLPSYNALLELATSPKRMPTDRDSSTVHSIGNVKAFSEQWLSRIWPKKTQDIAIQLFLLAAKRAEEVFYEPKRSYTIGLYDPIPDVNYSALRQSWIYSYINSLHSRQLLPDAVHAQVKRELFNINTRC